MLVWNNAAPIGSVGDQIHDPCVETPDTGTPLTVVEIMPLLPSVPNATVARVGAVQDGEEPGLKIHAPSQSCSPPQICAGGPVRTAGQQPKVTLTSTYPPGRSESWAAPHPLPWPQRLSAIKLT